VILSILGRKFRIGIGRLVSFLVDEKFFGLLLGPRQVAEHLGAADLGNHLDFPDGMIVAGKFFGNIFGLERIRWKG